MTSDNSSAAEPVAYRDTPCRRLQQLMPGDLPPLGAHLVTPWCGFAHHGIHVGDGQVIQYGALMYDLIRKPVEEVSLDSFSSGRPIFVVRHDDECLEATLVIQRARSRLGEKHYRLFSNNCEHFAEWCLHDVSRSFQAELALGYPRLVRERIEGGLLGFFRRVFSFFRPPRAATRARVENHSEPRE
jgi:hypothetical protein